MYRRFMPRLDVYTYISTFMNLGDGMEARDGFKVLRTTYLRQVILIGYI